jgi:K+-transporting ATPase ATPase C chain
MKALLRPVLSLFAVLTLLTGVVYPLAVTYVAQALFPQQAHGSLVTVNDKPAGSSLIGQHFSSPG